MHSIGGFLRTGVMAVVLLLWIPGAALAEDDTEPPVPSPAAEEMLKSMREKGILSKEEFDDIYRRQALYEYEQREREKAPPWARDWTVGGDIRLRWDRIDVGDLKLSRVLPHSDQGLEDVLVRGEDNVDFLNNRAYGVVNRYRLRFRIGAERRLDEDWAVGFRLVTSQQLGLSTDLGTATTGVDLSRSVTNFRSTNVDLGDYFEPKGIYLDRAYLRFNPEKAPALKITLGKFDNPFLSDEFHGDFLVWDHDIQPEGVALEYRFDFIPEAWWLEANFAAMTLDAINVVNITQLSADTATTTLPQADDRDPFILGYQLGMGWSPREWIRFGIRGAYYDYQNLSIREAAILADLGNGGDAIAQNPLFSEFPQFSEYYQRNRNAGRIQQGVLDAFLTLKPFGEKWPVTLFGQYSTLLSASTEPDGWGFGVSIGRPDVLRIRAMWSRLERNSTVALFTDSDLFDGFTNAKGWQVSVARNLSEHVMVELTYRSSQVAEPICVAVAEKDRPALFCDTATAENLGARIFDFRQTSIHHRKRLQIDIIAEF